MRRVILLTGLLMLSLPLTAAPLQRDAATGAAFEVVSIRPAFSDESHFRGFVQGVGACGFWKFSATGNRVSPGPATLCMLIRMAYDVTDIQVVGLPEPVDALVVDNVEPPSPN